MFQKHTLINIKLVFLPFFPFFPIPFCISGGGGATPFNDGGGIGGGAAPFPIVLRGDTTLFELFCFGDCRGDCKKEPLWEKPERKHFQNQR